MKIKIRKNVAQSHLSDLPYFNPSSNYYIQLFICTQAHTEKTHSKNNHTKTKHVCLNFCNTITSFQYKIQIVFFYPLKFGLCYEVIMSHSACQYIQQ